MTPITCADVAERLELYAADECDPPDREAVERHLAGCAACTAQVDETRRLLQLLDLRMQEPERLDRLHERLEAERRPRKRTVLPFLRRFAPLAALLLVSLGLTLFLERPGGNGPDERLSVAVLYKPEPSRAVPENVRKMDKVAVGREELRFNLETEGKSPADFRAHLTAKAVKDEPPPRPPEVRLELKVTNLGKKPLLLDTTDPRTELRLDVRGPAKSVVETAAREVPAALEERRITLAPGEKETFRIDRLVTGTREKPRALFWTEAGQYTVEIRLRVGTTGGRLLTIDSGPIRVQVQPRKPK